MHRPPERFALPIDAHLPALVRRLNEAGQLILCAEPGAGKSTRFAPALLDSGQLGDQKILLAQPRRVAARAVASRIAAERGVPLGADVGYRVRFDERVSAQTRIEVVSYGILLRQLQRDPFLSGVGAVLLDELHERSLEMDLSLALLRAIREEVRDDLRLAILSATLQTEDLSRWLGAPVEHIEGRSFPVALRWLDPPARQPLSQRCAQGVQLALREAPPGDVLVFLPGAREIDEAAAALRDLRDTQGRPIPLLPLHGRLPPEAQDRALAAEPSPKVVLATNIAETSVTLPRVSAIVDSGLERSAHFDATAGTSYLRLATISQASATQRMGRAGRTAPGLCVRLYRQARFQQWPAAQMPEIRRSDLSGAALLLADMGFDAAHFSWFEPPRPEAWQQAVQLLTRLGALDDQGITPLGRRLVRLPVHPRLGRILIEGQRLGALPLAAAIAALMSEPDLLREAPSQPAESDLDLRLRLLEQGGPLARPGQLAQTRRVRDQLLRIARSDLTARRSDDPPRTAPDLYALLLAGFSDRVALRRSPEGDRFQLAAGGGARLDRHSAVREAQLVIAVHLEGPPKSEVQSGQRGQRGQRGEHLIRAAVAIEPAQLPCERRLHTAFDAQRQCVVQHLQLRYLNLVLDEYPAGAQSDPVQVARVLAETATADALHAFELAAVRPVLRRLRWLAALRPELALPTFPWIDEGGLAEPWLEDLCRGLRSYTELRRIDLVPHLLQQLSYTQRQALDRLAPATVALPEGSHAPIQYGDPEDPPILAARIQQLFGLTQVPQILEGQRILRLHLLAPNQRPVQVTEDLEGFWRGSYADVRKELRGRYPKHAWPEDPLSAAPLRGAKPRKK